MLFGLSVVGTTRPLPRMECEETPWRPNKQVTSQGMDQSQRGKK